MILIGDQNHWLASTAHDYPDDPSVSPPLRELAAIRLRQRSMLRCSEGV
jgi:hypothetical protein